MLPEQAPESMDSFKEGWEAFLYKYRFQIIIFLLGAIVVGLGLFFAKGGQFGGSAKIQVLETTTESQEGFPEIVVEIAGRVEKPGVYKLPRNSRVEDLLLVAGGLSANSDRVWVEKTLNRAGVLSDGQKIYIPSVSEQSGVVSANFSGVKAGANDSQGSGTPGTININTASQNQLESLS